MSLLLLNTKQSSNHRRRSCGKKKKQPWWIWIFILLSIGSVVGIVVVSKKQIAHLYSSSNSQTTIKKKQGTTTNSKVQQQQQDEATTAQKKTKIQKYHAVQWVHDEEWFQKEIEKGCCPFAEQMYRDRYKEIEFRCCTKSRLFRNKISPLRAVGGYNYRDYYNYTKNKKQQQRGGLVVKEEEENHANHRRNNVDSDNNRTKSGFSPTTVVIQGDSLAEQHFLGMICSAWSEELEVDLRKLSNPRKRGHFQGTLWEARIRIVSDDDDEDYGDADNSTTTTNNNNNVINLMTIQMYRWNHPEIAPIESVLHLLRYPDYLILGGWHHGKTSPSNIAEYLNLVQGQYQTTEQRRQQQIASNTTTNNNRKSNTKIIVVEALPSHFPGGKYLGNESSYPLANTTTSNGALFRSNSTTTNTTGEVCDRTSFRGEPDINQDLSRIIGTINNNDTTHDSTIQLLPISRLYYQRGDAHVGVYPPNKKILGVVGRDCLHFCIAPGILDALVRTTLPAMN